MPWLRPSELPGFQFLFLPSATVTGESSTQLASEYFARLRERQQVHERLEQRTDGTLRFDRAIEAVLGDAATADDRDDVAVVHVGHHQPGLQRRTALVVQALERARDRAFGHRLRRGRHAAHHAQASAGERVSRIVARELASDQVDVRGEAIRRDAARIGGDTQRRLQRTLVFGVADQFRFVHLAEHEIAAF